MLIPPLREPAAAAMHAKAKAKKFSDPDGACVLEAHRSLAHQFSMYSLGRILVQAIENRKASMFMSLRSFTSSCKLVRFHLPIISTYY